VDKKAAGKDGAGQYGGENEQTGSGQVGTPIKTRENWSPRLGELKAGVY